MIEVKIPAVGESVKEVTITKWIKKDGENVKVDDPLFEIESDKATLEVPSPSKGKLTVLVKEGETVAIGVVVAKVDPSASGTESATVAAPAAKIQAPVEAQSVVHKVEENKPFPSPSAQKILNEKGIDAASVKGSGVEGRITKSDALNANAAVASSAVPATTNATPALVLSGEREKKVEKMSALRKTIAKRLVEAKNTTAMLTTFNEVDMFHVMELRKKYKDAFKEKYEVNLGFMSFFTKAAIIALKKYPAVNAMIDGTDMIYHQYMDIGVAVSAPKGLVVPVLRNAEKMSMDQIEKEIVRLATRARDNKLSMDEMQGGTFTITNGGVFGSMLSTPIINIPQSAILGMHNIVERPHVVNGEIKIRPIMYVALSYDHRIIDGRESVGFLKTIKEMIEDPNRLLLEV
jgi:2-oxoglutarate dehydrogenase E2 component (dihydrolipoamide succinyltransferase)